MVWVVWLLAEVHISIWIFFEKLCVDVVRGINAHLHVQKFYLCVWFPKYNLNIRVNTIGQLEEVIKLFFAVWPYTKNVINKTSIKLRLQLWFCKYWLLPAPEIRTSVISSQFWANSSACYSNSATRGAKGSDPIAVRTQSGLPDTLGASLIWHYTSIMSYK